MQISHFLILLGFSDARRASRGDGDHTQRIRGKDAELMKTLDAKAPDDKATKSETEESARFWKLRDFYHPSWGVVRGPIIPAPMPPTRPVNMIHRMIIDEPEVPVEKTHVKPGAIAYDEIDTHMSIPTPGRVMVTSALDAFTKGSFISLLNTE